MDMHNRKLIASHGSTIKAPRELNTSKKLEKDDIINDKADLFDKILRLREKKDQLVQERDQLK